MPAEILSCDDSWYRRRGYRHFDRPVSLAYARRYVQDPANVATHPFLPFISYIKVTPRYKPEQHRVVPKERPISYASHRDSHIYSWYSCILTAALERTLTSEACGDSVIAYRALGKCNIEYADDVFTQISVHSPCVVKAFDVSGFFDNIDHSLLKASWSRVLGIDRIPEDHYKVFKSITAYSHVQQQPLYELLGIGSDRAATGPLCTPAEFRSRVRAAGLIQKNNSPKGIPQGSPISALLSNVYLLDFDRQMATLATTTGGVYRRYSDDILWICPMEAADEIEREVIRCVVNFRLAINNDKTETCEFRFNSSGQLSSDRPLQYLGFVFDGQRRLVRPGTLSRYYRRVKTAIRRAQKAASRAGIDPRVFRKQIYERFSHLGTRNFISYGQRAARVMAADSIRRQLGKHWRKLHDWLPDDH